MQSPPPRLYKYQPLSAVTLAALKVRTIWFGPLDALNDPFDCAVPLRYAEVTASECRRLLDGKEGSWTNIARDPRYVNVSGQPTREMCDGVAKAGRDVVERFAADNYSTLGITCFSETPDNPLLWSHYGGAHRGLCLEFDTSSPWLSKLHQVRYADDSHEINLVDALLGDHSQILSTTLTKSACWSYEREWRALHRVAKTNYCYGIEALTGVYLGARLTASEIDLVCHTLHGTPTKLFRMRRSDVSFKLYAEPMTYTPYVHPTGPAV